LVKLYICRVVLFRVSLLYSVGLYYVLLPFCSELKLLNVVMRTLARICKLGIGMIVSKYNVPSTNLSEHEIKHRICGSILWTP